MTYLTYVAFAPVTMLRPAWLTGMTSVGIGHLTMLDVAPPQWVSLAHDAGFDFVGIRLLRGAPPERQWPLEHGSPMLAQTLRRLADTGTTVLDVEIVRLHPLTTPEDYQHLLQSGAELGATFINCMVDDDDLARVTDNFAELAEAALPYGLRPTVEAMPYMKLRTPDLAADVVRGTWGGVTIDPLHLHRAGLTPEAVRSLDPDLLTYFQICDAPFAPPVDLPRPDSLPNGMAMPTSDLALEARAMRLLPGEGDLPLAELLALKPDHLPLSVEAPDLYLRRSIGDAAFLRRAYEAVTRLTLGEKAYTRSA